MADLYYINEKLKGLISKTDETTSNRRKTGRILIIPMPDWMRKFASIATQWNIDLDTVFGLVAIENHWLTTRVKSFDQACCSCHCVVVCPVTWSQTAISRRLGTAYRPKLPTDHFPFICHSFTTWTLIHLRLTLGYCQELVIQLIKPDNKLIISCGHMRRGIFVGWDRQQQIVNHNDNNDKPLSPITKPKM